MGYIQGEFNGNSEDEYKMQQIFAFVADVLEPRNPKPPMKNAAGKWHFYLQSPDHKKKAKLVNQRD